MPSFSRTTIAGLLLSASALLVTSACAGAPEKDTSAAQTDSNYPVTISNCGLDMTITEAPKRAITVFQGATEVMLALGLEDSMVGTSGLDDSVADVWQKAFESIPELGDGSLSREELLKQETDFVYAAYVSAFDAEGAGDRSELLDLSIPSYVSPDSCLERDKLTPASFDKIFGEITDIAKVFNVTDRAEKLIEEQKSRLAAVEEKQTGQGLSIFWYDSDEKSPYAGAGTGAPQLIIEAVGASNIFGDTKGTWANVPWEDVIAADPDVIVMADATWSTAQEKIDFMSKDPALKDLAAVRNKRFVTLPFSETTPGVRVVDGAEHVSEQIAALNLDS